MRRQQTTATLLESERAKEREADSEREREKPRPLQASHALDRSRDPPPPSAVPYPARVDTKRTRREKSSCYRAQKFESATSSSSHNMPPPPPPLLLLCDRCLLLARPSQAAGVDSSSERRETAAVIKPSKSNNETRGISSADVPADAYFDTRKNSVPLSFEFDYRYLNSEYCYGFLDQNAIKRCI
ncbi:unnamed protein product [Trichogramma brassicae]|uniref:Uncharacterized protein n=1 Tax=Trichogramma brassicae TaxID=86971 RepID=A0A6H5IRV5_9HYME|nr:unnamed protein product [Trichogramma brassicae]